MIKPFSALFCATFLQWFAFPILFLRDRLFNLAVLEHSVDADDDDVLIFDRSDCIADNVYTHHQCSEIEKRQLSSRWQLTAMAR